MLIRPPDPLPLFFCFTHSTLLSPVPTSTCTRDVPRNIMYPPAPPPAAPRKFEGEKKTRISTDLPRGSRTSFQLPLYDWSFSD